MRAFKALAAATVAATALVITATPAAADIFVSVPPNPVFPEGGPLVSQPAPVEVSVIFLPNPGPPNVSLPNPGPPTIQ